jgi:RNA polymerase sigma-70 factor, ECF subfamily
MGMSSTALPAPPAAQSSADTARPASDRLEIEEVYEAHFDFVWRSARRLGASDLLVDDIVQEVFVVVQRRLAEFQGRSQLKTWLFGITRRVVRAQARRHARQSPLGLEELEQLADNDRPSAEAQLMADEDTRLLYALLEELDDDKREVFVLCELEEMSGPEIAEALNLQLSNVYTRVRVARQAFAAALQRHRLRTGKRC